MQNPLVSIIIPTYNRAHLIGETLDSVLAQTYENWECIIVDDGSTDNTEEVVNNYIKRDTRFQYHHRPIDRPKGGNAARNYGFEISKGEYVNWFDSDDLMLEDFILQKVKELERTKSQFVFSKSMNFNSKMERSSLFDYNNYNKKITTFNFLKGSITLCTLDFLARKDTLEHIKFNEILKSGQEFNFFTQYICLFQNGLFIDKFLSLRRIHDFSIQSLQRINKNKYWLNKYLIYLTTYDDIKLIADKDSLNHLIDMSMSTAFELASIHKKIPFIKKLLKCVYKEKGFILTFIYILSLLTSCFFKKGYFLMNLSRSKERNNNVVKLYK